MLGMVAASYIHASGIHISRSGDAPVTPSEFCVIITLLETDTIWSMSQKYILTLFYESGVDMALVLLSFKPPKKILP